MGYCAKYEATMMDDLKPSWDEVEAAREEARKWGEMAEALKEAIGCCEAIERITNSNAACELIGGPAFALMQEADNQYAQACAARDELEAKYFGDGDDWGF